MKKLIVFYSLEGNTRFVAQKMGEAISADLLEVKPQKDISAKGFMRYVWGGKAAMKKETPELLPLTKNIEDYDVLLIGTPVWAGTYAPALNTLFHNHSVHGKKIALFCCHAGGKGKVFQKMQDALPGNEFIGQIDFKDPLKGREEQSAESAQAWARSLVFES